MYPNFSPETIETMKEMQKIIPSPTYQAMVKQQEFLNSIKIPHYMLAEIQETISKIQPYLKNEMFLAEVASSQNFSKYAVAFQNAYKNFFTEVNKLTPSEKENLNETLKDEPVKESKIKSEEKILDKVKKKFIELKNSARNLCENCIYPALKKVLNVTADANTFVPVICDIQNGLDVNNFDIVLSVNALDNIIRLFK